MRIFNLDLREEVQSVWDKNIPVMHHTIIEVIVNDRNKIIDENLENQITSFCKTMNLNIVSNQSYQFQPQGISSVFILEESHLAIHSWPERNYIHIDMVTCTKEDTNLIKLLETLSNLFGKMNIRIISLKYYNMSVFKTIQTITSSRPSANHEIEQYLMNAESLLTQFHICGKTFENKRALFLGDDDHFSLLLSK